jgi:IMP and pyridine-specific 5'-nucleotidase
VPFVLQSRPTAIFDHHGETVEQMANGAQRRYAEIMRDVEELVNDHSKVTLSDYFLQLTV